MAWVCMNEFVTVKMGFRGIDVMELDTALSSNLTLISLGVHETRAGNSWTAISRHADSFKEFSVNDVLGQH
ncbi:Uncharacterized protein TCM_036567 [Theobroma cacao]|uniref:Uncharacterized protein n=1 Tax=Theobroma cacao TaxID=3641 RepID=A0A061FKG6_THECC|nr:Uncharacterized protein TCM_036567 [Theobroma cacao]